jgi:hypothetical protein
MKLTRRHSPHLVPLLFALGAGLSCASPVVESTGGGKGGGGSGSDTPGTSGKGGGGNPSGTGGAPGSGPGFALPDGGGAPMTPAPDGPAAACAEEKHEAQVIPLDLLLLIDTSGSMNELAAAESKWQLAVPALTAFFKDPRSAGLGIGLQYFPLMGADKPCANEDDCASYVGDYPFCVRKSVCAGPATQKLGQALPCTPNSTCANGTSCVTLGRCSMTGADCRGVGMPCPGGPAGNMCGMRPLACRNIGTGSCVAADYEKPTVPFAELPGAEAMLIQALDRKDPVGNTPTAPAVAGSLKYLTAHLAAHPERRGALVMVTDGVPYACPAGVDNSVFSVVNSIMAARTATPSVSTYAIGVFTADAAVTGKATTDRFAMAGGTGTSTLLTPGAELTKQFLDTLNQIRGKALACEFTIPPPKAGGRLDYNKVNVRYTSGNTPEDLLYVGSASRCDPMKGGWYYDVDPAGGATPTRVVVCDATCNRFKMVTDGRVDLLFGCATRYIP